MHRRPVDLPKCYRLLNHGPTVLVSAAHDALRTLHHTSGGGFLSPADLLQARILPPSAESR